MLDTSCDVPASSTRLADTGLDDSCHTVLDALCNKYKHVFRAKYAAKIARHRRAYGRLFATPSVNTAWHIRSGDINLHQGDADYYDNTRTALDTAARAVGMPSATCGASPGTSSSPAWTTSPLSATRPCWRPSTTWPTRTLSWRRAAA